MPHRLQRLRRDRRGELVALALRLRELGLNPRAALDRGPRARSPGLRVSPSRPEEFSFASDSSIARGSAPVLPFSALIVASRQTTGTLLLLQELSFPVSSAERLVLLESISRGGRPARLLERLVREVLLGLHGGERPASRSCGRSRRGASWRSHLRCPRCSISRPRASLTPPRFPGAPRNPLKNRPASRIVRSCRGSPRACGCAPGAAACARPWPRSGARARG